MSDRVACDISGGVADVRLTRAGKMNALDEAMFVALLEVGERLRGEKGLRAVVLSGEGRAFCAGLDMASFAGMAGSGGQKADKLGLRTLAARTHGLANSVQQVAWQWRELPAPVIAAVHGVAFGGGLQIALGADIRYAAPDTRFSIMEIKWGLVPDMAGTMLMCHLARDDTVRELTYTGRVFTAQEALTYGFVTRIDEEPRALALQAAREIAAKSPDAIRAAKRLLNAAPVSDVAAGLIAESVEQQALIGSPNQLQAVMANLGKREPGFADP
jgi:enoyl-CoA hydratase/carnithine racemase